MQLSWLVSIWWETLAVNGLMGNKYTSRLSNSYRKMRRNFEYTADEIKANQNEEKCYSTYRNYYSKAVSLRNLLLTTNSHKILWEFFSVVFLHQKRKRTRLFSADTECVLPNKWLIDSRIRIFRNKWIFGNSQNWV